MSHVNILSHRLLFSETQTDRQDTFVIDIHIYIVEYWSLCSQILALRYRCGVFSRTPRIHDTADILTV